MQTESQSTAELGPEWDEELLVRLRQAVTERCGTMKLTEHGVAGSQDIQMYSIEMPSGSLCAKAETYVGLRLSGPAALVQELVASLKTHRPSGNA
jgi:hypothetical protein